MLATDVAVRAWGDGSDLTLRGGLSYRDPLCDAATASGYSGLGFGSWIPVVLLAFFPVFGYIGGAMLTFDFANARRKDIGVVKVRTCLRVFVVVFVFVCRVGHLVSMASLCDPLNALVCPCDEPRTMLTRLPRRELRDGGRGPDQCLRLTRRWAPKAAPSRSALRSG